MTGDRDESPTRSCRPGRHEWEPTGRYIDNGQLYKCWKCGKVEFEP